ILETEHYIDGQHNGGIYSPMNHNTYGYTYNNPVIYVDPNGKQNYFTHGTWSDPDTFKDKQGLRNATYRAFGNKEGENLITWNGYNIASDRKLAAKKVVREILRTMSSDINEPITLVGHSHGGNVNIEALNMMVEMPEFKGRQLNLMTINTPVRDDYQLSEKAQARINHINVYDVGDEVQKNGGNSIKISDGKSFLTGEFGVAGQIFKNAINIETDNKKPIWNQHKSHNRVYEWIHKLPKQDER
ncbi:MAG: DUF2974 domain-containing protein, partial [Flavobacteriaceae bacterium]|nr:DUF2974 domain-containing protein [Flavobacteriaceae bacterium]